MATGERLSPDDFCFYPAHCHLEAIVTTVSSSGQVNPAPMGIKVLPDRGSVEIRPYKPTHTYQNLAITGCGVINWSFDGELFVYTAVGDPVLPYFPAKKVSGYVLNNCSWWEVEVDKLVDQGERGIFTCRVVKVGQGRTMVGFNRAQAALIEGAVLASRRFLVEPSVLKRDLNRLAVVIAKTGGLRERVALSFLRTYCNVAAKK